LPGEELVVLFEFGPVFVSVVLSFEGAGFPFERIVFSLGKRHCFHLWLLHVGLVFEISRFSRSIVYNSYFLLFVQFLVVKCVNFVERDLAGLFEFVSWGWGHCVCVLEAVKHIIGVVFF